MGLFEKINGITLKTTLRYYKPTHMTQFFEPDEDCFELVVGPNHLIFVVAGNPAVKKRAGRTKDGRAYNPSNRLEKEFAKIANQQLHKFGYGNFTFGNTSSLEISIELNFAVSGRNNEERQRSLWAKGDPDNFSKYIQDALQGTIYENDKQLVRLQCQKFGWVGLPMGYTRVEIKRCDPNNLIKKWPSRSTV